MVSLRKRDLERTTKTRGLRRNNLQYKSYINLRWDSVQLWVVLVMATGNGTHKTR